ncbi:14415_t:CDS:1, partial [Dentiscutata heterogama]
HTPVSAQTYQNQKQMLNIPSYLQQQRRRWKLSDAGVSPMSLTQSTSSSSNVHEMSFTN